MTLLKELEFHHRDAESAEILSSAKFSLCLCGQES